MLIVVLLFIGTILLATLLIPVTVYVMLTGKFNWKEIKILYYLWWTNEN